MASAVATPLERQFTTIAGIDSMTSSNSQGSTQITLQFDLDRDIDGAAVDVQTAIAAAMPLLPPGMPSPPSFRKVNPSDSPILFLTLVSDTLPLQAGRVRADGGSSAHLDGARRCPGERHGRPEVCRAREGESRQTRQPTRWASTKLPTRCVRGT